MPHFVQMSSLDVSAEDCLQKGLLLTLYPVTGLTRNSCWLKPPDSIFSKLYFVFVKATSLKLTNTIVVYSHVHKAFITISKKKKNQESDILQNI